MVACSLDVLVLVISTTYHIYPQPKRHNRHIELSQMNQNIVLIPTRTGQVSDGTQMAQGGIASNGIWGSSAKGHDHYHDPKLQQLNCPAERAYDLCCGRLYESLFPVSLLCVVNVAQQHHPFERSSIGYLHYFRIPELLDTQRRMRPHYWPQGGCM